jgi:hypothetical protein
MPFDPTSAVRFDLARGSVLGPGEERQVLLSCAALDDLIVVAGPDAAASVARAMGTTIGKRVAQRLGGSRGVRESALDRVIPELAGELSVVGIGVVTLERWGRAIVVAIENPAVSHLPFLSAMVEGVLEAATDAPVRCAPLGRDEDIARILVAGDAAIARARDMLARGAQWFEVLARVQSRGGAPP